MEKISPLRDKALALVKDAYEMAAKMNDLDITAMNRKLPSTRQLQSNAQLVERFLSRAGAVNSFAVEMGILTGEESMQIIKEFHQQHPEISLDPIHGL